ncbi:UDP-4-amino-4,6-dideoxy-N-acetyl-beta-L-altrosamine N-acetyltransferase [Clostridium tyrobutyricum]|uniref:UDP-4-amino-4, 6-dideoxy-N-acetyl-beta-L-altrosamine N-acetyltransferase n=1 Tax=Clostridium tyrobutyricum TaxID=1519 RepID=UPI001C38EE6F|nr:UDP-4-amino-4,6-dideoxy-N-acetyl-beta-L-altrosamine N-acetyltransferase [Clostridium tyrobutyricum]MBV4416551.1 UDP-4-amino-4,6-dideoxy-N-acetyl-beta-L-altrosamine N-acetyltransferase [Clostridium tyrobutyricum]
MSIELRKISKGDLKKISEWRMMPEVSKYMYTDPILTMDDQLKWYEKINNDKRCLYWKIVIDDDAIGVLSLNNIDYTNSRCVWAYYIGNISYMGRGIATTLECNIYNYVFNKLNLNKLCCEVFEFNDKVISIHKKFGSEVEGILKSHIIKNNIKYNVVVMGILKSKWEKIKKNYKYEKIYIE